MTQLKKSGGKAGIGISTMKILKELTQFKMCQTSIIKKLKRKVRKQYIKIYNYVKNKILRNNLKKVKICAQKTTKHCRN